MHAGIWPICMLLSSPSLVAAFDYWKKTWVGPHLRSLLRTLFKVESTEIRDQPTPR